MANRDIDRAELRDQIAETIHCRICEHSREDCIENLGKCERATDSTMPLISTALYEGNVLARLLSGALDDVIRTLRELAEKAAGEPIPFGDLDLYAEMVDGALDAAADAAARPAETVAAILDRHETPDHAELRRLLDKATPGPWVAEGSQVWGPDGVLVAAVREHSTIVDRPDALIIAAAVNALPDLLAQAWDQGLRAEQRRQEPCLLHDLPGEDVPGWEMAECTCEDLTNPYRQEAVLPDLLDQLARIDATLARSDHVCEIDDSDDPISCGWKRDIREVRGA